MKNFKRLTAGLLAGTMILGSAMTAMAALPSDVDSTNAGDLEAFIDHTIYDVTLPTVADGDFDFIMDPQGLLGKADAKAGGSKYAQAEGAIYFPAATDTSVTDDLEADNQSSVAVDVSLNVEVVAPDGVEIVEDVADLTDATTPSIFLKATKAVTAPALTAEDVVLGAATEITVPVDGIEYDYDSVTKADYDGLASDKQAEYVVGKSGEYAYKYAPKDSSAKETATFTISGECDKTADWSSVTGSASLKLVWSVAAHVDNAAPTFTAGTNSFTFVVGAGDDGLKEITHVVVNNAGTDYDNIAAMGTTYGAGVLTANTFTFDTKFISYFTAGDHTAKVTYVTNKGEEKTADVNVTFTK